MLPAHLHTLFFNLVRAGLWGTQPSLPMAGLMSADWELIYRASAAQTVSGIVYAGIANTIHSPLADNSLLARWAVKAIRIADRNERANQTISLLAGTLNSKGIAPVLLKGQANARLYNDPTLRECGDIDFFFPDKKDFAAAAEIIGKVFKPECKSDGSIVFNVNGVTVELHHKMFDMIVPSQRKYLSNAISELGFIRLDRTDNPSVEILSPDPVLNMLMQNLHILRHALCFGIGLRQLCDYAVCLKTMDPSEISLLDEKINQMRLSKWNSRLISFLDTYLYGNRPRGTVAAPIYKIVMENGNFGFSSDSRSWKQVISNNAQLFTTVPAQSLTTLLCLFARR